MLEYSLIDSSENIEALTCNAILQYQNRRYDKAEEAADRLLQQIPHDMVALYIKGATHLRLSRPDYIRLDEALACWSEAMDGIDSDDAHVLSENIERECSHIIYGSINRAAAYWKTYETARFANELIGIFAIIERCEHDCEGGAVFHPVIASIFKRTVAKNRCKWIALVTGSDISIPLNLTPLRRKGYADVLACMSSQAFNLLDRVDNCNEALALQSKIVAKRTFNTFKRFSARKEHELDNNQKELLKRIEGTDIA